MNTGRICSLYLVHMDECDLRQQEQFMFVVCFFSSPFLQAHLFTGNVEEHI